MKSFVDKNNIKHHVSSPYHPQSNGLIERQFFTIKDMVFSSTIETKGNNDFLKQCEKRDTVRNELCRRNNEIIQSNQKIKHRFNVGDHVMFRTAEKKPGIYSKRGPGKIVSKWDNKSYKIEVDNRDIIRHEDHIKLYHGKINKSEPNTSIIKTNSQNRYPQRRHHTVERYGFEIEWRGMLYEYLNLKKN